MSKNAKRKREEKAWKQTVQEVTHRLQVAEKELQLKEAELKRCTDDWDGEILWYIVVGLRRSVDEMKDIRRGLIEMGPDGFAELMKEGDFEEDEEDEADEDSEDED